MPPRASSSASFPRILRLTQDRRFRTVYGARVSRPAGPLVVYAAPSGLDHPRLGLSVSRKVGSAAARNRIKRLLREAFRLSRAVLPAGLDFVVVVRPHEAAALASYREWLAVAAEKLSREWARRRDNPAPARSDRP